MQFVVDNSVDIKSNIASINPRDRAFTYGDGCFTTMYAYNRQVCNFTRHLNRLVRDTNRLGIKLDILAVKHKVEQVLSCSDHLDGIALVVKIHVSRGVGGRGYEEPDDAQTSIVISLSSYSRFQPNDLSDDTPYHVKMCSFPLASQAILAGIKHLNRLEQIMAKRELAQYGNIHDLILQDQHGHIIEATASNLFIKLDGIWLSPILSTAGVAGVMRETILAYFDTQNIAYDICHITQSDLARAESVFLCNALKFLIPVSAYTVDAADTKNSSKNPNESVIQYNTAPVLALLKGVYEFAWAQTPDMSDVQ